MSGNVIEANKERRYLERCEILLMLGKTTIVALLNYGYFHYWLFAVFTHNIIVFNSVRNAKQEMKTK